MKATIFLSCFLAGGSLLYSNRPASSVSIPSYKVSKAKRTSTKPIAPIRIVVDKSDYELTVYDAKGWFATYPVVFGTNTLEDKKYEGDRNTPEGTFKIVNKKPHPKWDKFMLLDYPNAESLAKFNMRKQRGEIPKNARPGGGVGIHGTWPNDDNIIDRYTNWTLGCISLKNVDVDDLYSYVPHGTPVTIKR
ncbi:MAG TPA: L,D-transpeptidase [Chitinophagaceae bacterium]|nr:L,D-transpeptidase [Chitinophagaceae bacterium]